MSDNKIIRIKKGLDIDIPGRALNDIYSLTDEQLYAVKPTDFVGLTPRLLVEEGDVVKAGTPLFEDKKSEGIRFTSPVSGTVKAIVRGDKRRLMAVVVESDGKNESLPFPTPSLDDAGALRRLLVESGAWTRLRQRPFGIVPAVEAKPKAVFISCFDSSPLPVDFDYIMQERMHDFQAGIDTLIAIAGKVHLSLNAKTQNGSPFAKTTGVEIHYFEGPHPTGLIGTQIAYIDPINKGETVWTLDVQDVATIGHLVSKGEYRPERTVALCGPELKTPRYYRTIDGVSVKTLNAQTGVDHSRLICGDVLSGTSIENDGFLCSSTNKVSVLPEGDYYDFMGWLRPNVKKYSFSRTFLSGMMNRLHCGKKDFTFDTGRHGSLRPLFVTGEFEKLVPLDIYPMQLIKACIVGDIELMERLGIYEVEPEDLALCEFADTSKTEIQSVIRQALEMIRSEM